LIEDGLSRIWTIAEKRRNGTGFACTSGSAPIVVGAVALMLEVNPNHTTDDARRILRSTAVTDANTGAVPNRDWGHGQLDVFKAVQSAMASERVRRSSGRRAP